MMHQNDQPDSMTLVALQEQLIHERRKNNELLYDMITEIKVILTNHISEEGDVAIETNKLLREFISGLDALTHKKHHAFVQEKIEEETQSQAFWSKIKLSLTEKLLIAIVVFLMGGLGAMATSYFWEQAHTVHTKVEQQEKTSK